MLNYEFLNYIPFKKRSVYSEEYSLLHQLMPSDAKSVKFAYATVNKAVTARTVINKYIKADKMPLEATQRGTDVIVYKK